MALRFYRRIRVAPGLSLNLSKRGASLSMGPRGAHLTVGTSGTRETVGLPGSGLSYTTARRWRGGRVRQHGSILGGVMIVLFVLYALIRALAGV